MSATSQQKKSSGTETDSNSTNLLRMLQAALNQVDELPGVQVGVTTIYIDGRKVAAIVIEGCDWDDEGNLILIGEG